MLRAVRWGQPPCPCGASGSGAHGRSVHQGWKAGLSADTRSGNRAARFCRNAVTPSAASPERPRSMIAPSPGQVVPVEPADRAAACKARTRRIPSTARVPSTAWIASTGMYSSSGRSRRAHGAPSGNAMCSTTSHE
ncbi:MAG: hypothetical protein QOF00_5225 [Pseudonocardiales bacterium]|jgi:hypothetical protein|nr:hypothetical protein [Pseudonocardiales bacterium]